MEKISYKLQAFEGPLDLLLHLISKNKLNICEIQIHELLNQYMEQISVMKQEKMEIASEFLEMAAKLVYIKSVSLLPKYEEAEELQKDLEIQLLEYEECRRIARQFGDIISFDIFTRTAEELELDYTYKRVHDKCLLLVSYINAVGRGNRKLPPPITEFNGIVTHKIVSVSSRIIYILKHLKEKGNVEYEKIYQDAESKSELVATFLAVLELIKTKRVVVEDDGEKTNIKIIEGAKEWTSQTLEQE